MSELVGIAYGVDFLRNPSKRVHGRRDLEQGRWHIYELQKHAAFADQSAWLPVGGSPLSAASRLSMLLPIPHYRGYLADTVPAGRENHCLQLRLRHTSDCIASMPLTGSRAAVLELHRFFSCSTDRTHVTALRRALMRGVRCHWICGSHHHRSHKKKSTNVDHNRCSALICKNCTPV